MSKNPLEAGSQPLTSWERSKKKRPRVDVIVLLKILFFLPGSLTISGKSGGEFTPSGLDIKHFHFMDWINAFYEQRPEKLGARILCGVLVAAPGEVTARTQALISWCTAWG